MSCRSVLQKVVSLEGSTIRALLIHHNRLGVTDLSANGVKLVMTHCLTKDLIRGAAKHNGYVLALQSAALGSILGIPKNS